MMNFPAFLLPTSQTIDVLCSGLAQQADVRFTEWSLPASPQEWIFVLVLLGALLFWMFEVYRRDTQSLAWGWRLLLPTLRFLAIVGLVIVFLNPRTRTQTWAERSSRVAVLVDVSSSMQNPASDPPAVATSGAGESDDSLPTRSEQVIDLVKNQPWLTDLRKSHEVSLFTFDKNLSSRIATFPKLSAENNSASNQPADSEAANSQEQSANGAQSTVVASPETLEWENLLQPTGEETRLGDAVSQLMREMSGRTLSGVVVVTDGGSNSGVDMQTTNDLARQLNVRLWALGTGGVLPPVNLEVVKIVAPTDVQLGDPYDVEAYVRGEGVAGKTVQVQLLTRESGSQETPTEVDRQNVTILEDGLPVQVTFPRTPTEKGEREYLVRVTSEVPLKEVKTEDNERLVSINAFERPLKVLVFAGGPSWDYRFLCGVLRRHPGFEIDAFLQTGSVGMSQDVNEILFEFPKDRAALFEYDLVICFDPDWMQVPEERRKLFEQWVSEEGGGAVFVAGDIYTPLLAASRDHLSEILYLYPVQLDTILPGIDMVSASTQVRPIELTPEGQASPLLQITEDPTTSQQFWQDFQGFFRFYPTSGIKPGAAVYAMAGGVGEMVESEPPVMLAGQFYGQGRTFYLGSSEFYRLRAEDPAYFERFWTRLAREAAQNRLRRSNPRGTLLVDQETIRLGDSLKIRARLLNAEFEPLILETIPLEVEQPNGRLLAPAPLLRPDPAQPGRYIGEVRGSQSGRYQVRLRMPDSNEILREAVMVEVPDLENRELRQDQRQLQILTAETGGGYLPLTEANQVLTRLPDSSEQFLLGEQIQTLWDRSWFLLCVVGLFGTEWLLRKLLKLA